MSFYVWRSLITSHPQCSPMSVSLGSIEIKRWPSVKVIHKLMTEMTVA